MNGGSFRYLVKQGLTNVWLNRVMSLASVGILTACLIILGGAGLLSLNVSDLFTAVENQNEVVIFIKDDATGNEISTLQEGLEGLDYVAETKYISKEDALEEQKEYMGEQGYLLDGLEKDNPLPASFRITLSDLQYLDETVAKIELMEGVETISAPTNLAHTLNGIEKTLLVLGAIIIGILLVASVVVISNTIKLTVFSRKKEINIMKYVGATNSFIKFPFVVEGMTIGIISSVLAFGIIAGVYASLSNMLVGSTVPWVQSISGSLINFWDIWYYVFGGFFVGGVLIGMFGSSSAMRKYLRV